MESLFMIFHQIGNHKASWLQIQDKSTLETPAPQCTRTLPTFNPEISNNSTPLYFFSDFIKVWKNILRFFILKRISMMTDRWIVDNIQSSGYCDNYLMKITAYLSWWNFIWSIRHRLRLRSLRARGSCRNCFYRFRWRAYNLLKTALIFYFIGINMIIFKILPYIFISMMLWLLSWVRDVFVARVMSVPCPLIFKVFFMIVCEHVLMSCWLWFCQFAGTIPKIVVH